MNKQFTITITTLILLGLTLPAAAQIPTSSLCTDSLIRGTYGFTIEGQKLGGNGLVGPQVGVAMTTFDGDGHLTQIDTVTINGVLVSDFNHTPATGTYKVNDNCTGTFTMQFTDGRPTVHVNFVVDQAGNEIDTVVLGPPLPATMGVLATRSIGKRRFLPQ